MPSYVLTQILKNRKITEYLGSKGLHPIGQQQHGKVRYLCPLHTERTPSFTVYLNGEHENFFCYGCKARYSIVHLYSAMEKISIEETIKALSGGLELDLTAELAHAVREIEEDSSVLVHFDLAELAISLGRTTYDFLKMVDNDPDCVASVDKIHQLIDQAIANVDVEALGVMYESLPDTMAKKTMQLEELREKRIRSLTRID